MSRISYQLLYWAVIAKGRKKASNYWLTDPPNNHLIWLKFLFLMKTLKSIESAQTDQSK